VKDSVKELVAKMTLEEKAGLCSGSSWWTTKSIERLGLPSILLTDGPHGVRKQMSGYALDQSLPATCYPTAVGLAATWDRELIGEIGKALGEECQQEGIAVLLGPGVNIKRSPLCGRNFEFFSEDPLVAGEMAAAFINGVQSQGVGTSLKHYAVNNQESRRMTIDALVDQRALREIYLTGFEIAVKQGKPWTVMPAYNKINGSYACEHEGLLRTILREEWGFDGVTVSDWGAVNDRVNGLKAGLDLEMPTAFGYTDKQIVKAVREGLLDESIVDETAKRIVELVIKHVQHKRTDSKADHHQLARRAAADSMVLLRNERNLLPLNKTGKLGLIGDFAQHPRYQGAGSSQVNPTLLDSALDALRTHVNEGFTFSFARGYDVKSAEPNASLIQEACELARSVDVVVIMAGLMDTYEAEGFDRQHLELPQSHQQLIEQVMQYNDNIVVVLSNGSPVRMPWLNGVSAVLETYLAGQASGSAVWDVLFGDVNPSGKLAETFPLHLEDAAASTYFPMGSEAVEYRESLYVGYRYFDTAEEDVLFPFGYGMSYTKFQYSDLRMSKDRLLDTEEISVIVKVKNIGDRAGQEVIQLYVEDLESTIFRPKKELRGFEKIMLLPGEEKLVSFTLGKRAFAYYNTALQDWQVESGEFHIHIASSSKDIQLTGLVEVIAAAEYEEALNDKRQELPSYYQPSELKRMQRKNSKRCTAG